jgi:hypothetical protein
MHLIAVLYLSGGCTPTYSKLLSQVKKIFLALKDKSEILIEKFGSMCKELRQKLSN